MTAGQYRSFNSEPSRAEPSRAEPSRAEPSRAEPSRAEPSRAEPSRAEPSRAEPSRAEPSRAEPSRAEPSRAEPSRAEPSRAEPSRAEPSRAEPSRAEPSRAEPSRAVGPQRRRRPRQRGNVTRIALGVLAACFLVPASPAAAQTAGVTVSPLGLTIQEGSTGSYTVVLDAQPTDTVTISVTASDSTSACHQHSGASCTRESGVATVDIRRA